MKRSIQTSKPGHFVGLDFDSHGIRAARLFSDGRGTFLVDRLEEVKGDFSEDAALLEGFRKIKGLLGAGRDPLVTCLAGKQVFASQIDFRRLSPDEMDQALRLELRKTVHFEVATSTFDYQILSSQDDSGSGPVQVLVALAGNALLNRTLQLLEKAGLRPMTVDVLPVAIANALWSAAEGPVDHPLIGLHIGAQISTIAIVGEHTPFFNRTIYFAAEDVFRENANPSDREKRIQSLSEEISRSLLFYDKSYGLSGHQGISLLGDFVDGSGLVSALNRHTSIAINKMDLPAKLGFQKGQAAGHFDLAVSLALRGDL